MTDYKEVEKEVGPPKRLVILQVLLTAIICLNLLLWPSGWISNHTYQLTILLTFLAVFFLPAKVVLTKGTIVLASLTALFCLLHFSGFFYANNASLIWTKSFHWLFLVVTLLFAPAAYCHISSEYWKKLFATIIILNCAIIWGGILYALISISPDVGFFYADSRKIASYFFKNDNYISALLVLQLPILFILNTQRFLSEILLAICISCILGAVVLLSSRFTLVTAILMTVIMFVIRTKKLANLPDLIPKVLIIIFTMSVFLRLVLKDWNNFIYLLNPFRFSDDSCWNERVYLWKKTWAVFCEEPLLGVGAGNWIIEVWKYGLGDLDFSFNRAAVYHHAHNYYFELLAETGLIGLCLFATIWIVVIYLAWQAREKLVKYLFAGIMTYGLLLGFYGICYTHTEIHSPLQWIFIIYLALLSGLSEVSRKKVSPKFSLLLKALALTALALCGTWSIFIANKSNDFRTYDSQSRKLDPALALDKIREVYHPTFFKYYRNRHLKSYVAKEQWRLGDSLAIQTMLQALEEHPYDAVSYMNLGDWYKAVGQDDLSYENYLKGFQIHPRYYRLTFSVAESALDHRDWPIFEEALSFYEVGILPSIKVYRTVDLAKASRSSRRLYRQFLKYQNQADSLRLKRIQIERGKTTQ